MKILIVVASAVVLGASFKATKGLNGNMQIEPKLRSNQANKALHLFFTLLADELNNAGLDMRKTLKPGIDIPWSANTIKEYLWRPIQISQLQKQSTTELTTSELTQVYDVLNRHLGERFGLFVPFPSYETDKS